MLLIASGVAFQKSKLSGVTSVLYCIFFRNALTNASLNVLIYLETVLSFTIATIGVISAIFPHASLHQTITKFRYHLLLLRTLEREINVVRGTHERGINYVLMAS